MKIPDDLSYTKSHEWVRREDDLLVVGITHFAQEQLGDITFVDLPAVDESFEAEAEIAVVESVKAASDIYAPVPGTVVEVNDDLEDAPERINEDPYGTGWIYKLRAEAGTEDQLLTAKDYQALAPGRMTLSADPDDKPGDAAPTRPRFPPPPSPLPPPRVHIHPRPLVSRTGRLPGSPPAPARSSSSAASRTRSPTPSCCSSTAPPITLGRRGNTRWLLSDEATLTAAGIALHRASRGGDVTYHGPGQVVMYPVCRVAGAGAHGWLDLLQQCAIDTAKGFGVEAFARPGMNGAWTDRGKISAIGFALKRWVSHHGLSFNVRGPLPGFDHIVGCGLENQPIAALSDHLGQRTPTVREVAAALLDNFRALRE